MNPSNRWWFQKDYVESEPHQTWLISNIIQRSHACMNALFLRPDFFHTSTMNDSPGWPGPSLKVRHSGSRCPWNQKRLKLSVNANQYYSQQGWTFLIMSFQLVRLSSKQFALQKWWSYLNTIHVTVFQSATPNDMKLYRINMDRWVLKIIGSWLKVS